jgi:hypothetical protein
MIALRFDSACDKRHYNLPSAASREIAVIIPGSGEEHRDVHDIVLWRRGGGLNEMSPLHPCHNKSDHIFKAGCLFQEYIVDSWAATEQSCLTWLRNNQKTLCSDVYKGLVDAVAANPDPEAQNLGQRTILLSTFSGSSHNMIQHCQDALAINHHFKGANLFMTVTTDPNWPEIQAELLPG